MRSEIKMKSRFVAKCFFSLSIGVILAGIAYEQIGERRGRTLLPQIGRSVNLGGRSLNIFCSGEGGPAVILDTGGSSPG